MKTNSTRKQEKTLLRKMYIIFETSLIKINSVIHEIMQRTDDSIINEYSVLSLTNIRNSLSKCIDDLACEIIKTQRKKYIEASKGDMSGLKCRVIQAEIDAFRVEDFIEEMLM